MYLLYVNDYIRLDYIDVYSTCLFYFLSLSLSFILFRIVLLENTLSTNPVVAAFQHITEPLVTPLAKGCRWDVDVHKIAQDSGLELDPSAPTRSASLGAIRLEVFKKSTQ